MTSHTDQVKHLYDIWTANNEYPTFKDSEYLAMLHCSEKLTKPAARVLDIGCGTGNVAKYLKRMGHHVVGLDLSEIAVQTALQNKSIDQGIVGDFIKEDFPENSFDAVLCVGVVCLVFDLKTFFKKIEKVLKPGGEVILIDHNSANPYVKLHFARPDWVDRLIDRSNVSRHPMNPQLIYNSSPGEIEWRRTNYFNHFTRHPKFLINFVHHLARSFFGALKVLFNYPWANNVIVMVGRKNAA